MERSAGNVLIYLLTVGVISVLTVIFDKLSSKFGGPRVPEKVLLLLAVSGGSAAMLMTMLLIRHKTKRLKFMLGIPVIIFMQAAAATGLYFYFS